VPLTENVFCKNVYFEIPIICFFGSDELENDCGVVEKCACASKTSFAILLGGTHTLRF